MSGSSSCLHHASHLALVALSLLAACAPDTPESNPGARQSVLAGQGASSTATTDPFGIRGVAGSGGVGPSSTAQMPPMAAGQPALTPIMAGRAANAPAAAPGGSSAPVGPAPGGAGAPAPPPVTMPAMPTGPAMPAPAGNMDPVIPAVAGECPQLQSGTISFMNLSGIQLVAGPKPSGPTGPMVFYWHGTGSSSGEYSAMAGAVAQGVMQEGGVLVSFQGSTGGDLLSGTSVFGVGDFKLTDQLVACAVKNNNVDPRRIFTTGCSAGGLFAGAMGAARSTYMAAAAPNSGGFTTPGVTQFQNKHAPALMTIHGAPGTDVVIVDFSQTSASADSAYKALGGFVVNCNHGGGHCGGGGLAGDIWKFFKAHPFGVSPEPWATALPSDFSPKCMIYNK